MRRHAPFFPHVLGDVLYIVDPDSIFRVHGVPAKRIQCGQVCRLKTVFIHVVTCENQPAAMGPCRIDKGFYLLKRFSVQFHARQLSRIAIPGVIGSLVHPGASCLKAGGDQRNIASGLKCLTYIGLTAWVGKGHRFHPQHFFYIMIGRIQFFAHFPKGVVLQCLVAGPDEISGAGMQERMIACFMSVSYRFFPSIQPFGQVVGKQIKSGFDMVFVQQGNALVELARPGIVESETDGRFFSIGPHKLTVLEFLSGLFVALGKNRTCEA